MNLLSGNDLEVNEFMERGIKIKTMNDYKKDIKKFQKYLADLGERTYTQNYLLDPFERTTDGVRDQAKELVRYAVTLSKDDTLCPTAFDAQFYAIKRMMLNNVRDIKVFEMESVAEARRIGRSQVSESRKRTIQAMEDNERAAYEARYATKVPFTEEMMRSHREDYFASTRATREDKMAYVATALGYHAGNRPSEGSSNGPLAKDSKGKSDGDHRYTVEDIQYQLLDGSFVTGVDINPTNKEDIQFISVMVDTHKGETIRMLSSKSKTKRQANSIRKDNGEMELQLFNDMVEWPGIAKLKPGDIFFSRNAKGSNLKLTTASMVSRMKETARKQDIDPARISAKSLRKAMGTDLTRSNVTKATINAIGRWAPNSNVCASIYASAAAGNITGTMSEGVVRTTNNDVKRLDRTRERLAEENGRR